MTSKPTQQRDDDSTAMGRQSDLSRHTASGAAWLVISTVASRVINVISQVILAWILVPQHFGLIALAYTVTSFFSVFHQAGLRQVLVHRQRKFHLWAGAGCWMAASIGFAGSLLMALAAPLAALIYGDVQVAYLILVLAIAAPIQALHAVPSAALRIDLRFRVIANVAIFRTFAVAILSILFASLGFGAFSFAVPLPITECMCAAIFWFLARPPVRLRAHLKRWRYLWGDTMQLLLANLAIMVTLQGDYLVLGILHNEVVVGVYFFAYNLSTQTLRLLTVNLTSVLFPALAKLAGDRGRQTAGFLKAIEVLALVGIPVCLLQAALAGPVIQVLFSSKWYPGIPILQVLSLGMAPRLIASPSISLLQAQGRFRTYRMIAMVNAVLFLVAVTLGAAVGEAMSVAVAVALYSVVIGPVYVYLAIRPAGLGLREIGRIYFGPCLAGALAVGAAWAAALAIPLDLRGRNVVQIIVVAVVSIPIYVTICRRFMPDRWFDIAQRIRDLAMRRIPKSPDEVSQIGAGDKLSSSQYDGP